ncbi:hypothetical protein [Salana multivorans]
MTLTNHPTCCGTDPFGLLERALATEEGRRLLARGRAWLDDACAFLTILAAQPQDTGPQHPYREGWASPEPEPAPPPTPTPSDIWQWHPRANVYWRGVDREVWDTPANQVWTRLAAAVGGAEALATLGTERLPDEDLSLEDVPMDIQERICLIDELLTAPTRTLFGSELLTSARRVLNRVAVADPAIFRRRTRDDTAAAAITWVAARLNDELKQRGVNGPTLAAAFQTAHSPSSRALPMQRAIGAVDIATPWSEGSARALTAGDPTLLTSGRRRRILAELAALTASEPDVGPPGSRVTSS